MRVRTLEIRWHDSKPINSCDFQPVSYKKARPANEKDFTTQSYRLATSGEDNNVRIWMVYPNILPPSVAESVSASSGSSSNHAVPHASRVEYLATLTKHSAPVNVVRFSPDGELIASAGDDGMVIVWSPSSSHPGSMFGSDPEEPSYEREFWKARTPFRCSTMQVYDLAWSPTGEYIITGSTDNTARIFTSNDGKCVREIAEHSHFVQGVAWDPMNEYIVTQSSDRAVHVYSINANHGSGAFEAHAVGKNTRMTVNQSRTPSVGVNNNRSATVRREPVASDAESAIVPDKDEPHSGFAAAIPLTPAPSIANTPSNFGPVFLPPPSERTPSRRSSFSSAAPGSPAQSQYSNNHMGRSPSPMPPLPAIRAPPSPQLLAQTRLYGDESFTNFFRRLTFSPDGALLFTPSGHFEDPSNIAPMLGEPSRGRRGNPADSFATNPASASSVFIYSRANFSRPPIAQLPGHKKPSVAVKFSPILYDLRPSVIGPVQTGTKVPHVEGEHGMDEHIDVDMVGPVTTGSTDQSKSRSQSRSTVPQCSPQTSHPTQSLPSPALSAVDHTPQTPVRCARSTSASPSSQTGSVFKLPYRMLYAVATMDTITIYDTQQAGPIALLTKLHYDEFTDMTWSPDGQCLILSSRDGYCTIVVFDQILPAYHVQQHSLQLKSIAVTHHHAPPPSHQHSTSGSVQALSIPPASVQGAQVALSPMPIKRSAALPTPDLSGSQAAADASTASMPTESEPKTEPPKKKRRVALTRLSDVTGT